MPEVEVLRALEAEYTIRRHPDVPVIDVLERGEPAKYLGYVSFFRDRVTRISIDWTPASDAAGAFAETLLSMLPRLSTRESNGWKTADGCMVSAGNDVDSPGFQARLANITCGDHTIVLSVTRSNGGLPRATLQLETVSEPQGRAR